MRNVLRSALAVGSVSVACLIGGCAEDAPTANNDQPIYAANLVGNWTIQSKIDVKGTAGAASLDKKDAFTSALVITEFEAREVTRKITPKPMGKVGLDTCLTYSSLSPNDFKLNGASDTLTYVVSNLDQSSLQSGQTPTPENFIYTTYKATLKNAALPVGLNGIESCN